MDLAESALFRVLVLTVFVDCAFKGCFYVQWIDVVEEWVGGDEVQCSVYL